MLSTIFPFLVVGALVLLVILVMVRQELLRQEMHDAIDFVRNGNSKAVSLARMADVEATLTELLDSYDSLLKSHKKLRARIGMRATRESGKSSGNGVDLTDEAQKAAYKARMRADLRARGLL